MRWRRLDLAEVLRRRLPADLTGDLVDELRAHVAAAETERLFDFLVIVDLETQARIEADER